MLNAFSPSSTPMTPSPSPTATMSNWTNPLRRLSPITQHPSTSRTSSKASSITPLPPSGTSSLSPAPSDTTLHIREAEVKVENNCRSYGSRTLLLAFLSHLQSDGQNTMASDVLECTNEQQLVQLANHLLDAIIKPFVLSGGKAPYVTTPPTDGAGDEADAAMTEITRSTRHKQGALRRDCLRRDGYQCVYTGAWDTHSRISGLVPAAPGRCAFSECAHILPFALGDFKEHDSLETRNMSLIWWALYRYFPRLADKIGPDTINQPANALILTKEVHSLFGECLLAFEPLATPHTYRANNILGLEIVPSKSGSDIVEFTTSDPTIARPDPAFLAVHFAVSQILHVSGLGRVIYSAAEEAYLVLDCHMLHPSGSTDVEKMLGQLLLTTVSASAGDSLSGHRHHEDDVKADQEDRQE